MPFDPVCPGAPGFVDAEMLRILEGGGRCVLATVLSREGSAPRLPGTSMIVREDATACGTIGGGAVEAAAVSLAAGILAEDRPRLLSFDLSGTDADGMDLVCGGRIEVLCEPVSPSEGRIAHHAARLRALQSGERHLCVTAVETDDHGGGSVARCLVRADGSLLGAFPYPLEWLSGLVELARTEREATTVTVSGVHFLVEPGFVLGRVIIFGAGHVGIEVEALARRVGFHTVVVDDRPEYANRERFPRASRVVSAETFEAAFRALDPGPDAYIVIVTRGHRHDKSVLGRSLATPACYIGMIGSLRKRDAIYEALLAEGVTEAHLARVHSPIGLAIGAETPEEIALSIVAELVKARAGRERS